jgi:RimJ/RimL family protein N-acetyltransferase
MFEPVTIETARLRLRPLQREDAPAFFEFWSDPANVRYFSFAPMHELGQAQARIDQKLQAARDGTSLNCVIEARETGQILGDCALFNGVAASRRAEIGYCLGRRHWGQGYMFEAADALVDHGLQHARVHRIEADIDPHNLPSIRLVERLGFKREGYLRERWMVGTQITDTVLYGLIRSDRYPA